MGFIEKQFPHTVRFYRDHQLDSLSTADITNLQQMGFVISEAAETFGKILKFPQPLADSVTFGATPEYCVYTINKQICFEMFILSCGNQIVYVPESNEFVK